MGKHEGNQGGRPTEWTQAKVKKLAVELDRWRSRPEAIVLEQFCNEQDIYPELISRLYKKKHPEGHKEEGQWVHPEFRLALKRAKAAGIAHAVEALLDGNASSGGMVFILKNISTMRDKREVDVGNKDGEPFKQQLTDEEGEAIAWGVSKMIPKTKSDAKNGGTKTGRASRKTAKKPVSKKRGSK